MRKNKKLWIIIGILILIGLAFLALHKNNKVSYTSSNNKSTTSGSTKNQTSSSTSTPTTTSNNSTSSNAKTSTTATTNTTSQQNITLISPTGSFVSNHNPSLSNSALSTEQSTCNTNPGVSCNITFTNTSTNNTISLGSKTTNSSGSAYWTWTLQGVGLTQGNWKITATSSYNQESKSVNDSLLLSVN